MDRPKQKFRFAWVAAACMGVLVAAACLYSTPRAEAKATERILVAVGYTDAPKTFWEKSGLVPYPYTPALAMDAAELLTSEFTELGFQPVESENPLVVTWENRENGVAVDVVDPNMVCPGSAPDAKGREMRPALFACADQRTRSRAVADFVRANLLRYDAFLFFGHARFGSGLAFGDFNDTQAKVDVKALARKHYGKAPALKIAAILTCASQEYYSNTFDSLYVGTPPAFIGVKNPKATWGDQFRNTRFILKSLAGGVARYAEMLPKKSAF